MGSRGLFLAPWTLDFNPEVEITAAPVWVRLASPSLAPLGDKIFGGHRKQAWAFPGQYGTERGPVYCTRICVEVNLEKGLPEAINLSLGEWHHIQELDYEQIPFKCLQCHAYGHFARSCPKASEELGPAKEDDFQPVTNRRR
jgi:hypothetical protein